MTRTITVTVGFVVLFALVCLAMASLIRGFLQAIRYRGGGLPFQPVVDLFPPEPVERTTWVLVVGLAAVVWSLTHLVLALLWSVTGLWFERTGSAIVTVSYFCFGAVLTGIGGAMLMGRFAYGRRMISWGQFLLAVAAFMGLAISLMIPHSRDLPPAWRVSAWPVAIAAGAYLVLGTAMGAAAQHVGRPRRQEAKETERAPEAIDEGPGVIGPQADVMGQLPKAMGLGDDPIARGPA
jgi:hypothetical protein